VVGHAGSVVVVPRVLDELVLPDVEVELVVDEFETLNEFAALVTVTVSQYLSLPVARKAMPPEVIDVVLALTL
jgi:hypothetical protein